jgi:hypothetical protein
MLAYCTILDDRNVLISPLSTKRRLQIEHMSLYFDEIKKWSLFLPPGVLRGAPADGQVMTSV